jgi:FKBP-type peptidyl-prolyl cis-trans isomerase SlyD
MKPQVISFHCVLKTKLGRMISSTTAHDVITLPGANDGHMLEGLVEGLRDIKGGEKRRIAVSAERAYGFYDPSKVIITTADALGDQDVAVGQSVKAMFHGKMTLFRVTEVLAEEITLDANHPLAGEDLVFEVEAVDVREAGPEDLDVDEPPSGPVFH